MNEFFSKHPLRIDLPDGTHVRFRDLAGAARTALDRKLPLWDEVEERGYSVADCRRLVDSRETYGTHA